MSDPSSVKLTPLERQQAIFLLGPWLIGTFIDLFLQGGLVSQFISYYTHHNRDKVGTRVAVAVLALLTTLQSAHAIATIWVMLILHFKDIQGAILLNYTAWWQTGNPLMVATIDLYVQLFFVYRVWVISKKNIAFVVPITIILALAYLAMIVATYYITKGAVDGAKIGLWFAIHLSAVFAGDLLLTTSTAFLLLRNRKDVLPGTVGILQSLVRLTFSTAAPAALCAMFNLLFSQLYRGDVKLISTAFNLALPKLYAFSMMWTLNARRSLRKASGFNPSVSAESTSHRGRRTDVELSAFSHRVQVLTQTDVTRHVDFQGSGSDTKAPVDDVKRIDHQPIVY